MNSDHSKIKNKTILIVEDDQVSAEYLYEFLKTMDTRLLFASTGEDSVKTIRDNTDIDLVLMDIRLPGMNGYDATREIKSINKNIPIIAQTAFALSGDKEKALAAGCDDYITKPIKPAELIEKLNKLI